MYHDFKGQNWNEFNKVIIGKKLFLYAYGEICKAMLAEMRRYGCKWNIIAIIDSYKEGEKVDSPNVDCKEVKGFEYLLNFDKENIVVLICSMHAGEIAQKLENAGIDNYYSSVWMDADQSFYYREVQDDPQKVIEIKNYLSDEESCRILDAIVEKRSKGHIDYSDIKSFYKSEYFIDEFWEPSEDEVFVDGGAYDGDTIEEFYEWTKGKFGHIYSFEPQKDKYEHICSRLWRYGEKLTLYNKGLWSKETTLYFADGTENESGHITDQETDLGCMIETCSLDEVIHERVTFIKMDIEGAEIEALKGARKLITTYKPKLAICIYHKPEDLLTIPAMIHEMVPEYKLYIRQNGACGCYGTVLYASLKGKI